MSTNSSTQSQSERILSFENDQLVFELGKKETTWVGRYLMCSPDDPLLAQFSWISHLKTWGRDLIRKSNTNQFDLFWSLHKPREPRGLMTLLAMCDVVTIYVDGDYLEYIETIITALSSLYKLASEMADKIYPAKIVICRFRGKDIVPAVQEIWRQQVELSGIVHPKYTTLEIEGNMGIRVQVSSIQIKPDLPMDSLKEMVTGPLPQPSTKDSGEPMDTPKEYYVDLIKKYQKKLLDTQSDSGPYLKEVLVQENPQVDAEMKGKTTPYQIHFLKGDKMWEDLTKQHPNCKPCTIGILANGCQKDQQNRKDRAKNFFSSKRSYNQYANQAAREFLNHCDDHLKFSKFLVFNIDTPPSETKNFSPQLPLHKIEEGLSVFRQISAQNSKMNIVCLAQHDYFQSVHNQVSLANYMREKTTLPNLLIICPLTGKRPRGFPRRGRSNVIFVSHNPEHEPDILTNFPSTVSSINVAAVVSLVWSAFPEKRSFMIRSHLRDQFCDVHIDGFRIYPAVQIIKRLHDALIDYRKEPIKLESSTDLNVVVRVAIDDYQVADKLNFPVQDSGKVTKALQEYHGFDNKYETLDGEATIEKVLEMLKRLSQESRTKSLGKVVFYFAGHGEKDGILLRKPHFADDKLLYSDLSKHIFEIKCKHLLIVLDCCHSGGAVSTLIDDEKAKNSKAGTVEIFFSSSEHRTTTESSGTGAYWFGSGFAFFFSLMLSGQVFGKSMNEKARLSFLHQKKFGMPEIMMHIDSLMEGYKTSSDDSFIRRPKITQEGRGIEFVNQFQMCPYGGRCQLWMNQNHASQYVHLPVCPHIANGHKICPIQEELQMPKPKNSQDSKTTFPPVRDNFSRAIAQRQVASNQLQQRGALEHMASYLHIPKIHKMIPQNLKVEKGLEKTFPLIHQALNSEHESWIMGQDLIDQILQCSGTNHVFGLYGSHESGKSAMAMTIAQNERIISSFSDVIWIDLKEANTEEELLQKQQEVLQQLTNRKERAESIAEGNHAIRGVHGARWNNTLWILTHCSSAAQLSAFYFPQALTVILHETSKQQPPNDLTPLPIEWYRCPGAKLTTPWYSMGFIRERMLKFFWSNLREAKRDKSKSQQDLSDLLKSQQDLSDLFQIPCETIHLPVLFVLGKVLIDMDIGRMEETFENYSSILPISSIDQKLKLTSLVKDLSAKRIVSTPGKENKYFQSLNQIISESCTVRKKMKLNFFDWFKFINALKTKTPAVSQLVQDEMFQSKMMQFLIQYIPSQSDLWNHEFDDQEYHFWVGQSVLHLGRVMHLPKRENGKNHDFIPHAMSRLLKNPLSSQWLEKEFDQIKHEDTQFANLGSMVSCVASAEDYIFVGTKANELVLCQHSDEKIHVLSRLFIPQAEGGLKQISCHRTKDGFRLLIASRANSVVEALCSIPTTGKSAAMKIVGLIQTKGDHVCLNDSFIGFISNNSIQNVTLETQTIRPQSIHLIRTKDEKMIGLVLLSNHLVCFQMGAIYSNVQESQPIEFQDPNPKVIPLRSQQCWVYQQDQIFLLCSPLQIHQIIFTDGVKLNRLLNLKNRIIERVHWADGNKAQSLLLEFDDGKIQKVPASMASGQIQVKKPEKQLVEFAIGPIASIVSQNGRSVWISSSGLLQIEENLIALRHHTFKLGDKQWHLKRDGNSLNLIGEKPSKRWTLLTIPPHQIHTLRAKLRVCTSSDHAVVCFGKNLIAMKYEGKRILVSGCTRPHNGPVQSMCTKDDQLFLASGSWIEKYHLSKRLKRMTIDFLERWDLKKAINNVACTSTIIAVEYCDRGVEVFKIDSPPIAFERKENHIYGAMESTILQPMQEFIVNQPLVSLEFKAEMGELEVRDCFGQTLCFSTGMTIGSERSLQFEETGCFLDFEISTIPEDAVSGANHDEQHQVRTNVSNQTPLKELQTKIEILKTRINILEGKSAANFEQKTGNNDLDTSKIAENSRGDVSVKYVEETDCVLEIGVKTKSICSSEVEIRVESQEGHTIDLSEISFEEGSVGDLSSYDRSVSDNSSKLYSIGPHHHSSDDRSVSDNSSISVDPPSIDVFELQSVGDLSHFQAGRFMAFQHTARTSQLKGHKNDTSDMSLASSFVQKAKINIQDSYSLFGKLMESEPKNSQTLEIFHTAIESKLLSIVSEQLGELEEGTAFECMWTLVFLINNDLSVEVVLDLFQKHLMKELTSRYRIGLVELLLAVVGQVEQEKVKQFNTQEILGMINHQLQETKDVESKDIHSGKVGLIMNRGVLVEYLQPLGALDDQQLLKSLPQHFDVLKWYYLENGLDPEFSEFVYRAGNWESIQWMHSHFKEKLDIGCINKMFPSCCLHSAELIQCMATEWGGRLRGRAIRKGFTNCCRSHPPKTIEWMYSRFKTTLIPRILSQRWIQGYKTIEEGFKNCCHENNLETIQWMSRYLKKYLRSRAIKEGFQCCCETQTLEVIQWMANHFKKQISIGEAFQACCKRNTIEAIQWMSNHYKNQLTPRGIKLGLKECSERRYFEGFQWIAINFEFPSKDMKSLFFHGNNMKEIQWLLNYFKEYLDVQDIRNEFEACCRENNLESIQWMYNQFDNHLEQTEESRDWFLACCRNNKSTLETIEWMYNRFEDHLGIHEIREGFMHTCGRNQPKTIEWMYKKFKDHLGPSEIREGFKKSCVLNQPETIEWMRNEFEDHLGESEQ